MTQHGVSARVLQQTLRLTYKVAWMWAHKLRRLMELETKWPEAAPPFRPLPWQGDLSEHVLERVRAKWHVFHGAYEWEASRPGGLGECCERLDRRDWSSSVQHVRLRARDLLFSTCTGSLSDKHLAAYVKQTEFRLNHRGLALLQRGLAVIGRFARTGPYPYPEIRGDRPAREPIAMWSVSRGGASPPGGGSPRCAEPRRSAPSSS